MADFLTDLFNSIFTPGPTPPLVRATNAAFAALQLLLLLLLVATRSPHFGVLTVLCGGLWWAINWFVRELEATRAEGEGGGDSTSAGRPPEGAEGTGRTTSGEHAARQRKARHGSAEGSGTETEESERVDDREATVEPEPRPRADLRPPPAGMKAEDTLGKRQSFGGDVSGTDSEWDKISETEGMGDSRMSND